MRHLRLAVLALGIVLAPSCASHAQQQTTTDQPDIDPLIPGPRGEKTTTLRVENQNFNDMVIYVLQGSSRIRIGEVTGGGTATLRIPDSLVGNGNTLRFLADPIGGSRTPVSDTISVQPGDQVQLTIPSN
jgi:hypothetical protein